MKRSEHVIVDLLRQQSPPTSPRTLDGKRIEKLAQARKRRRRAIRFSSVSLGILFCVAAALYGYTPDQDKELTLDITAIEPPSRLTAKTPAMVEPHVGWIEIGDPLPNGERPIVLIEQHGVVRLVGFISNASERMVPLWQLEPSLQLEIERNWNDAGYSTNNTF